MRALPGKLQSCKPRGAGLLASMRQASAAAAERCGLSFLGGKHSSPCIASGQDSKTLQLSRTYNVVMPTSKSRHPGRTLVAGISSERREHPHKGGVGNAPLLHCAQKLPEGGVQPHVGISCGKGELPSFNLQGMRRHPTRLHGRNWQTS